MNTTLPSGSSRQPRDQPLMVGRERERQALDEHESEMESGSGRLILIGGEAGIGKTTLVESFSAQARARGALVRSGHCYDLATTPPLGPWVELIGTFPDGVGLPGQQPDAVFDADSSGLSSQAELFQRVLELLVTASTTHPLVLLLEDIHRADDASLDLLLHVARNSRDARILLIATYRDDELTHRHPLFRMLPRLIREARAERLHLTRLKPSDLERLVAASYSLDHAEQAAVVDMLVRMSDGNPLYATELLRSLEEEQRLLRDGERWHVTNLDRMQVPLLIRQVIEARLAHLDESTQRLLEIAAVIGQEVSLDLWRAITDVDDTALADAIDQAIGSGLIEESGVTSLRFTHALIRETIHERLSLLRRRPLHQRIATALIESARPDPDAIVYHLEQTGDARLADWLIRSGDRAQQRFAWPVAAERLTQAQALLAEDPARAADRGWLLFRIGVMTRNADRADSLTHLEDAERIASAVGDRVLQHLAGAHKGLVLCYGKDVRQGLIDLEAGVLALEQLDETDAEKLQRVMTEHEPILGVQGRATLAQWLAVVGRFHDAATLLGDWNDVKGDSLADAHRTRGVIASYLGEPDRARHWFHRSRAIYEARNDRAQAGDDTFHELLDVQIPYAADDREARHQLSRMVQAFWTGHDDERGSYWAARSFEAIESMIGGQWSRAAEIFDRQRNQPAFRVSPFSIWWLRLARLRGETHSAWAAIRLELPDGPATEPFGRTYAVLSDLLLVAADLTLDATDLEQGRTWLEAHDRLLARSGAVRGQAENQLGWARYFQMSGDRSAACTAAKAALDHASNPRQPFALMAAKRLIGTLSDGDQLTGDADRHLSDALALADASGAPFERALTLLVLAERRVDTGDLDEAKRLITEARSILLPLGAEPALLRLRELEERLTERPAGGLPGKLSQREAEVLRLVAQGLSDAEVADQLFIARRTVNTHLTAIYTKLGVNSRVAATRFAVEHGLT